jgi:hypothetical protein
MDPVEAAYIAAAYATETRNILDAEAYLAERRYRQTLIAAQAARASMVKAVKKREDAITDVANMHDITMTATTGINCRPAPIDGGLVDSLYDDTAKLGYIGGFHSQYNFNSTIILLILPLDIIVSDGST